MGEWVGGEWVMVGLEGVSDERVVGRWVGAWVSGGWGAVIRTSRGCIPAPRA